MYRAHIAGGTIMKRILIKLSPILLGLLLLAGCPNEHPTIQVANQKNQTGGSLLITGSGFTPGNPVSVSILNAPGLPQPWTEKAGSADGSGKINVTVSYSYPGLGKLPGCQTGNPDNYLTSLNVTGTDSATHVFAAAQADTINCEWAVPQVSNHQ
jgi:hypothetical protein